MNHSAATETGASEKTDVISPEEGTIKSDLSREAFETHLDPHLELTTEMADAIYGEYCALATKKQRMYPADIRALVEHAIVLQDMGISHMQWKLKILQVLTGTSITPTATIELSNHDDKGKEQYRVRAAATGNGAIDAITTALNRATESNVIVKNWQAFSISPGSDGLAQAEVELTFEDNPNAVLMQGLGTDPIEATTSAILLGLNWILDNPEGVPSMDTRQVSCPITRAE